MCVCVCVCVWVWGGVITCGSLACCVLGCVDHLLHHPQVEAVALSHHPCQFEGFGPEVLLWEDTVHDAQPQRFRGL